MQGTICASLCVLFCLQDSLDIMCLDWNFSKNPDSMVNLIKSPFFAIEKSEWSVN